MTTWKNQYPLIKAKADAALRADGKSYSLASMAGLLKVSRGKVQAWERGQRPSADDLQKMAEVLGFSPTWLLLEEGEPEEMYTIRRLAPNAPSDPACIVGPDDKTPVGHVVPVHNMAAAGPALDRWEPIPICHVCVPLTYYRETILVVQISGRSMEPEIRSGAFVGIDTAQRDYVAGEKYGLRVPYEGLTIKRLFVDHEAGAYRLRSINPDHPEIRLPIDETESIIVGKAVWVMQGL